MQHPTVFISYSWDSEDHKAWVRQFASALQTNGVQVVLDQWDAYLGMDLPTYMATSVREADYVLLVSTPAFADRANAARGGVGYETMVVTGEIFHGSDAPGKFVPILRHGEPAQALPSYLKSKHFIDFRHDDTFAAHLEELLRHLHRAPRFVRPPIGTKPHLPPHAETPPARSPEPRKKRAAKPPFLPSLPSGVITAMFTDIVNSTTLKGLMEGHTAARRDAMFHASIKKPHDDIVLTCVAQACGHKVNSTGDGYCFAFSDAEEAVLCGLEIQAQLCASPVTTPLGALQVRIGLHTGIASPAAGDYTASTLDKAARVESKAEPGQVFVSHETRALVIDKLRGVAFEDKGAFELKGLGSEHLYRAFRTDVQVCSTSITPGSPLARVQNPYEFDTIATGKTFKGRTVEIEDLLDSIHTGTHTAVFGLQRMGKTSLIEEVLREGLQRHAAVSMSTLLVKIDMQRLGGAQVKYKDFLHAIIEAITEKVSSVGLGRAVQNLKALTQALFVPGHYQRGDRTEFFTMLAKIVGGFADATQRRIVLFVDEFSEVRKVIEQNKTTLQRNPLRTGNLLPYDMYIDVPFIHHLSSLLKDPSLKQQFTLVVLVRPFISEYDEQEGLQLLKLMKPITLYYLDEKAAKALITEPLEGQVTYENGTVDYLYWLTAGHPYLLQFILKILVDKINREGRRSITRQDVMALEERMVAEGPAYDAQFAVLISDYSVDEVMHPKEALLGKGMLALVAHCGHEHADGWVDEEQIFTMFARYKIPAEKTALLLSQLTRTKILEEASADGALRYRVSIPLLQKRFVRQNLYLKYFRQAVR